MLGVGNVGSSLAHVQFVRDGQSVWAGTDMETLSVWKTDDVSKFMMLSFSFKFGYMYVFFSEQLFSLK